MESQVNRVTPVEVEVTVEFGWTDVEREMNNRYAQLMKTVRIKGFRPGKAPRGVVKNLFKKQVEGEVISELVERGLIGAMQEHELPICSQPEIDEPELKDGEGLRFVAKCEVRPEIEDVNTSGLKIYRDLQEVSDEAVDAEVTTLQREHSELQTPDPMRPAIKGDELIIDFEVSMEGEPQPEMGTEGRPVEVGSGAVLDAIDEALAGMQPGETKTVDHTFDAEHPREDIRSKTASFHINVRELRERNMPELDDEFAKDCGDYETLADLRLSIRTRLEEAAAKRSEGGLRDQAVERLIDANEITVPPSMIRQQQQQMMQELGAFFQMQGMGGQAEELFQTVAARAERRVAAGLLLGAMASSEDLEISNEDIEARLLEVAEETGKHVAKVRAEHQGERLGDLRSQLLERRLVDLLIERSEVLDGPMPEPEPEPEAETAADATSANEEESETP